jgi:hypothetical protein
MTDGTMSSRAVSRMSDGETNSDTSADSSVPRNLKKRVRRRNQFYADVPESPTGSARSTLSYPQLSAVSSLSSSDDLNMSSGASTDETNSASTEDDDEDDDENVTEKRKSVLSIRISPKASPSMDSSNAIHPGIRGSSVEGNVSTSFLDDYGFIDLDLPHLPYQSSVVPEAETNETDVSKTANGAPSDKPSDLPHEVNESKGGDCEGGEVGEEDWSDVYAYFYEEDDVNGLGLPTIGSIKSSIRRSFSNLSQLI